MPEYLPSSLKDFGRSAAHPTNLATTKMGDLVGPLLPSQAWNKFVVVAVEYFTRWIEAKPLATITSETMRKFFWQNIICRFGVPRTLTIENGKMLDTSLENSART